MSDILNTPWIETVERARRLAREKASNENIVRGIYNDVYTKDIPREFDWNYLKSETSITCVAEYNTGFVSVNTQNTACVFQSGATITSAMTGRKIKFNGNPNVYDFTFAASNSGTISPPLSGKVNVTSGGYTIFQDTYALASDFDRFPVNGGILFYSAGQPQQIPEREDDDWYGEETAVPSTQIDGCRFNQYDSAGNLQVQLTPPPQDPIVLPYEYLKVLTPMKFTSSGQVDIVSGATAVSGGGTYFTDMNTGDYLRVDAFGTHQDSQWHRIDSISSNSDLTITPAFKGNSNVTAAAYTICTAPQMPYRMQDSILAGIMKRLLLDQNDQNFVFYHAQFANILSDNKVLTMGRKAKDDIDLIASDYNYRF